MPSPGGAIRAQLTDVFAQRKLFKRPVSGWAHAITFWAFLVLLLTIIEAYGALFQRDFAIPVIGRSAALGLIEDIFAVGVLAALVVFTAIRLRQSPKWLDRRSRFYGSHVDQAYIVLAMIFGVIATLLLYRGGQIASGYSPCQHDGWWPFASKAVSYLCPDSLAFESVFIVAQIAIVTGFLVLVLYSKHMHIFTAPLNAMLKCQPEALGALGTTPDIETLMEDEGAVIGVGQIGTSTVSSCCRRSRAPSAGAARTSARHGIPASRSAPATAVACRDQWPGRSTPADCRNIRTCRNGSVWSLSPCR
jgi:hypothetical protein